MFGPSVTVTFFQPGCLDCMESPDNAKHGWWQRVGRLLQPQLSFCKALL